MRQLCASLLWLVSAVLPIGAAADTLVYPTREKPSFLLDYPGDWELTQAESEGDYMMLSYGQTILQFRTIPGTSEDLQQAVADSQAYVSEQYSNVQLQDPKDATQHGLTAVVANGSGEEKEVGPVRFLMAWIALNDGTIGEIWAVAAEGDETGRKTAAEIVSSMRSP